MQLRQHQIAAQRRADEVIRKDEHSTLAWVTPGGGKSGMASLFASELLKNDHVERVAWIVPRLSLRKQVRDAFTEWAKPYCAREATNVFPLLGRNLADGELCYVTTYQSVGAASHLHEYEFKQRKYLLILDEFHHLADDEGAAWAAAVRTLAEDAAHVLLMTGTIERGDRRRIPFLDYHDVDGTDHVDLPESVIRYSREDAIGEGAILAHDFVFVKGWTRWYDCSQLQDVRVDIDENLDFEMSRKAIQSFLGSGSFCFDVVSRSMEKWIAYRKEELSGRMLIVCYGQEMARRVKTFVEDEYQKHAVLAISDEKTGQKVLRDFREKKKGDVLVTVGMAYEGFDCPDISHVVCLTNIRTRPWIEQVIDRGNRLGTRSSTVIVPDDPPMRAILEQIREDQQRGLRQRREGDGNGGGFQESLIVPGSSAATDEAYGTLHQRMPDGDAVEVQRLREKCPRLSGWSPDEVLELQSAILGTAPAPPVEPEPVVVPQDLERERKQQCEQMARMRDRRRGLSPGDTNKMVIRRFKKSRKEMGVDELGRVLDFLTRLADEEQNGTV